MFNTQVDSEIGRLQGVILHTPGEEIEQMTPSNSNEALYSDILNLPIVQSEYSLFSGVLSKWTDTLQVKDLLEKVLLDEDAKQFLIDQVLKMEHAEFLLPELTEMDPKTLVKSLIEGYRYKAGVHPESYAEGRFVLKPLYNLFFTRDASSSVYDNVLIHNMSTAVRAQESLIMETIFRTQADASIINPNLLASGAHTEGGDILVAREDVLLIGNGTRTNKAGIDFLVNYFTARKQKQHILVQMLPEKPESFIHLDMVFNFLAKDTCVIFEPLIAKQTAYQVTHIEIDNGKVTYRQKDTFLQGMKDLGFDLKPLLCGGKDQWNQEREQWHSGANFFCLDDGRVIGYARNRHTLEALNQGGFEILSAKDICSGKIDMQDYKRFVVAFEASELPRGGGGARCMTMPFTREKINW